MFDHRPGQDPTVRHDITDRVRRLPPDMVRRPARLRAAGELARRRALWKKPAPRYTRGLLAKFAHNASSASSGAVLDKF